MVENNFTRCRERKNELSTSSTELTWVLGFLHVIALHVWIIHTSPGFLPRGFHDSSPARGPLKAFFCGYFDGTRIGSK